MPQHHKITYTKTDEAPALATQSLLPIINAFTKAVGVEVELKDISLAARILSQFADNLTPEQQVSDDLKLLGELVLKPEANIIKLPNISASAPQLKAAIRELQKQGYAIPDYPEEPTSTAEKDIKSRYNKAQGSAVNPVLREGNSDRRAPKAVKDYAKKHPHRMVDWSTQSGTSIASMTHGDFYGSERSCTIVGDTTVDIIFTDANGRQETLKHALPLLDKEIIDAAVMNTKALRQFLKEQQKLAKDQHLLYSVHLKATMMKVSDPIIFGHAVETFFGELFDKHGDQFEKMGVSANNGLASLERSLKSLKPEERALILADIKAGLEAGPDIAMVNSDKGITNLHVPSDVIIDASMPAMIRNGGKMWDKDGAIRDTLAIIPDRSYAGVYHETVEFCKQNGSFDPSTMGSVSNVGLMAQKAEEYGSHDKTFEIPTAGSVSVVDANGKVFLKHEVEAGDIWRMCQTKDAPIKNWVQLAVARARATRLPTIFWLDKQRGHDTEVIKKVETFLKEEDIKGLDIRIMSPVEATRFSLERAKQGEDTISVTGNVLRDYLTDLFPILELGTSAKMLSIVPLMQGGGLFETGAGGSAPKHVQQFEEENHLRWDSLGEFLALAVSLEHLGNTFANDRAVLMAKTLDLANGRFLDNDKSPSRKVGELDTRGSHFYLAMYWAQELAKQDEDGELKAIFTDIAQTFTDSETIIVSELNEVQGNPVDLAGYYKPSDEKVIAAMRPSATMNRILESLNQHA